MVYLRPSVSRRRRDACAGKDARFADVILSITLSRMSRDSPSKERLFPAARCLRRRTTTSSPHVDRRHRTLRNHLLSIGIVVRMYFGDHPTAHFHAVYGGDSASSSSRLAILYVQVRYSGEIAHVSREQRRIPENSSHTDHDVRGATAR